MSHRNDRAAARQEVGRTETLVSHINSLYPGPMDDGAHEAARSDAARNRRAVLNAAVDMLAVDPGASLAEIASRAGVARATLYRHFPCREALCRAIQDEALAQVAAALRTTTLEEGNVQDSVRRAVRALLPLGMRFRVLLAEGADTDPSFLVRRDEVLRPLHALVRRGVVRREFTSDADPAWIEAVLDSLLVTTVRALNAGLIGEQEAPDVLCRTLFQGLGAASADHDPPGHGSPQGRRMLGDAAGQYAGGSP